MKEELLHYLWENKLIFGSQLFTKKGDALLIKSTGFQNLNSGPDFLNAKLKIGDLLWVGNVEIHVKSSDWYVHKHEVDKEYDSVILHVVWEYDMPVFNTGNIEIAVLEIKKYITQKLLDNYEGLFNTNKKWINCEGDISSLSSFVFENWKERLFVERFERKALFITGVLEASRNNWEETLFRLLCKNFGLKINDEVFYEMAKSLPFSLVRKESVKVENLESLFFGQLGLLFQDCEDSYFKKLVLGYEYQMRKYDIEPISLRVKFFRLRPINFPTIRISQFANLYSLNSQLFSKMLSCETLGDFYLILSVSSSVYWESHYNFDKESKEIKKTISKSFINLLLTNTILPLLFVYQKQRGDQDFSKVLRVLKQLAPEHNSIIKKFENIKVVSENAYDSQALLELKNEYCEKQKCLKCAVGNNLLKA